MREVKSEQDIDAPIGVVWGVLTDFAAYPQWNPFVVRIAGSTEVGQILSVTIQPPGRRSMVFHPRVLCCEANSELRWLGRFLLPGIFDGEHAHRLAPLDRGGTRYVQSEEFRGVVVPFAGRLLAATQHGFEAMNAALKTRAEYLGEGGGAAAGRRA